MSPYYDDGRVTIYHGDCRELFPVWDLTGAFMVTDPPYGRGWTQGRLKRPDQCDDSHGGIVGDLDVSVRDDALRLWSGRPAIVFGDLMLAPPADTKQVLVYRKPPNAGTRGAMGGYRRDVEAIYLIGGLWTSGLGGASSVIQTREPSQGNPSVSQGRTGHPHTKPLDVMRQLVDSCPPLAAIVDPFAGSGSTLRAAKDRGRPAIGVEVEERYCETAARRLAQEVLPLWDPPAVVEVSGFDAMTGD